MTSEQDCGGNLRPELREIIQSLLDAVGYVSPREKMEPTNLIERIRNALNVKIRSSYRGTEDCDLDVDSISKKAASVVEFFYFDHGFEQKMSFELYAWFFFYIDDIASGSRDILENFHRALLQGKAELLPAPLARFPSVLASLYDHWDPLAAAMMATSALDFITGTALEQRRHVVAMEPSVHAPNWPGFLRTKSGMATGFSCAAFPRSDVPGVASYIQALPDMDQLMCLTNDILSCVCPMSSHLDRLANQIPATTKKSLRERRWALFLSQPGSRASPRSRCFGTWFRRSGSCTTELLRHSAGMTMHFKNGVPSSRDSWHGILRLTGSGCALITALYGDVGLYQVPQTGTPTCPVLMLVHAQNSKSNTACSVFEFFTQMSRLKEAGTCRIKNWNRGIWPKLFPRPIS
ncbi:unnamed protein product [Mycena citricolor]|uniref:Terpenoid synthase n=1 Tax=Mycena citricolor TaxID=2018698 RepID=A0AAD2JZK3_9AGAR|nr:unnamed protein product [Mycena citricolor]